MGSQKEAGEAQEALRRARETGQMESTFRQVDQRTESLGWALPQAWNLQGNAEGGEGLCMKPLTKTLVHVSFLSFATKFAHLFVYPFF